MARASWRSQRSSSAQTKNGKLHGISEERPRRLAERNEPEAREVAVAPRAVRPRSDDERLLRLGTERVHRLRRAERPVRILAVEPSADEEHGGRDVLEVRRERALLPERVVVRVRHHRIPERELVAEVLRVGVLVRPHVEEEVIAVGVVAVHRHRRAVVRHRRLGTRAREAHEEIETLRERERAVVMAIVAEVPVDERRLRTRRLVRRMCVDHAGGGEEARRRDAPRADATVVVRDVLDQPVDRVVGVGAFVDVLGAVLDVDVRRHVLEVALRHEPPARVLVDEDETVVAEPRRGTEPGRVLVGAVGRDAVRRARHHDRIAAARVARRVDRREELHAVASADAHFGLLIAVADPSDRGRVDRAALARRAGRQAR